MIIVTTCNNYIYIYNSNKNNTNNRNENSHSGDSKLLMRIEINIYNSNGSKVIIVIRLVLLREKGDFQNINTSSTAQGVALVEVRGKL